MASPLAQALALQNQVQPAQVPISPTDVLGAYKLSSDVAEKNYQAKVAQMQGTWGGLASLGAAGILGFGKPWAQKYFGGSAANAASGGGGAAADATPTAASSTSWTAPDAAATGSSDAAAPSMFDIGTAPADFSIGDVAPSIAPSIAADYGLTDAGAGAAGSVAADMAAAAPAEAVAADAAASTLPDWLAGLLAFL